MVDLLNKIARIVANGRTRSRLSVDALAQLAGLRPELVAQLERAESGMSTRQLGDLARALELDPAALLRGEERLHSMPSVFLRHAQLQDFDDADGAILDLALDEARALADLRVLLGEASADPQAGIFTRVNASGDKPARDGYRLAVQVRKHLKNPSDAIGDFAPLIESHFGIAVVVRPLATRRATAVSACAGTAGVIVLNANDDVRRRSPLVGRVHLAHELCHLIFDPLIGGVQIVLDVDEDRSTQAAEQRARGFAAEFLLPFAGLKQLLGEPRALAENGQVLEMITQTRAKFGTPHEITARHLYNHGYIDEQLREWAAHAGSTLRAMPHMTLPASGAASRALTDYVRRAHESELITDGEARSILRMSPLADLPWETETS